MLVKSLIEINTESVCFDSSLHFPLCHQQMFPNVFEPGSFPVLREVLRFVNF